METMANTPRADKLTKGGVQMAKLELKISGLIIDVASSEKFLEDHIIPYLNAWMKSQDEQVQQELLAIYESLQQDLAALEGYYDSLSQAAEDLAKTAETFHKGTTEFMKVVEDMSGGSVELVAAARSMQEMQMSFNLQYLMLQNKISHENRQFSMVSNIMKNKHDTAKNAINNIR